MTPEDLAAIEARADFVVSKEVLIRSDIPALIAEVRRLREENTNQQIVIDLHKQDFVDHMDEMHTLEAEVRRLREENERLGPQGAR